jgi:hypothetical protein
MRKQLKYPKNLKRFIVLLFLSFVLTGCMRSASTPPTVSATPNLLQQELEAARAVLLTATAEREMNAANEAALTAIAAMPTDPPQPTATDEPTAKSAFEDMSPDDYGYAGREWALSRDYIPGCVIVDVTDPTKIYSCHDDTVPKIGLLISGMLWWHEDGNFRPPASTNRAFEDPEFGDPQMAQMVASFFSFPKPTEEPGSQGQAASPEQTPTPVPPVDPLAFAEEASRLHLLPDWFLELPPDLHFIDPLGEASECDAHISAQFLVHGAQVQASLEQYIAPENRVLEYAPGTDRICIGAMERNVKEKVFRPATLKKVDPEVDNVTWAYWSEILKNADVVRNQLKSTPTPTSSATAASP